MPQIYSTLAREKDHHSLPDIEIFYSDGLGLIGQDFPNPGWYYWYCLPGCLPDSEPFGPFDSFDKARTAIREENDDDGI